MNRLFTHLSIVLFLSLFATVAYGQQEPQYTQFMHTKQLINPAYVGSRGNTCFKGLYRNQWLGFKGAPVSQVVTFNMPFIDPRVGFGVNLQHYEVGVIENWEADLAYSYNLVDANNLSVRVGVMGSIRQFGLDFSDPDLFIRNINDESITRGEAYSTVKGDVGAGLYVSYEGYYFGVSVPNILSNVIGRNKEEPITAQENAHFYAMAGGLIPINDSKLSVFPNVLLTYVQNAPWELGINLSLMYDNKFTFGGSYRLSSENSDSIDFLFHFQATNNFGFGLSYDYPLFEIRDHTSGTIEVMMDYCFGSGANGNKDGKNLSNPRFFF